MPVRPKFTRSPGRGRGFTLAELLVVIGIIALLIALLLPALGVVNRKARQAQTRSVLSSIATALEQYQSDFGDYPRFSLDDPMGAPNPLNSAEDRGARLLARALFGPAPANDNVTTPGADPADFVYAMTAFQDGHGDAAVPFGFKERRQVITRDESDPPDGIPEVMAHYPGKIFSYLDPERFLLRQTSDAAWQAAGYRYGPDVVMLDPAFERPILYYPGLRKPPDISQAITTTSLPLGLFVDEFNQNQPQLSLYNSFDNRAHLTRDELRALLGDQYNDTGAPSPDGRITLVDDGSAPPFSEKAATTATYLLIAVGSDGLHNVPIANFQPTTRPAP